MFSSPATDVPSGAGTGVPSSIRGPLTPGPVAAGSFDGVLTDPRQPLRDKTVTIVATASAATPD